MVAPSSPPSCPAPLSSTWKPYPSPAELRWDRLGENQRSVPAWSRLHQPVSPPLTAEAIVINEDQASSQETWESSTVFSKSSTFPIHLHLVRPGWISLLVRDGPTPSCKSPLIEGWLLPWRLYSLAKEGVSQFSQALIIKQITHHFIRRSLFSEAMARTQTELLFRDSPI